MELEKSNKKHEIAISIILAKLKESEEKVQDLEQEKHKISSENSILYEKIKDLQIKQETIET